jgi:hypothetical protein
MNAFEKQSDSFIKQITTLKKETAQPQRVCVKDHHLKSETERSVVHECL